MNVLHLLYDHRRNPWVGGGGAVRAHEINRRLVARGATVHCLCGAYPGAPAEMIDDGVTYEFAGARQPYPLSRWTYSRAAGRALGRRSYDIAVVDFSAYTPVSVPPVPRGAVVAVVHHLAGPAARQRWGPVAGAALRAIEARRLRRFRWISAVSADTLAEVAAVVPPTTRLCVIGNAVDDTFFRLDRREVEPPFILYLGRLDLFHKGLDVLLHSFADFVVRCPGVSLRIAGTGKDAATLRSLVAASPAREHIQLLGAVSLAEKYSLLAGARMVAMPSRLEGWGMVAAEAMAAGAPLIASTAGALPEVTGGGVGAILIRPDSADELTTAMMQLDSDLDLRRDLGARARAYARDRYDWNRVAEQHYEFLDGALRENGEI